MRTSLSLFVVIGLVATLSACAPTGEEAATDGPAQCLATSGSASDSITVEGKFAEAPKVKFDFPVQATTTERTVLIEGEGDAIADGDVISLALVMFNATTGEEIPSGVEPGTASAMTVSKDAVLAGLVNALQCSQAGSRVVAVLPPADLWGDAGLPSEGISGSDSMVMVADIVEILPEPEPVAPSEPPATSDWTNNVPKVDLSGDTPVVTLPKGEAPTELQLAVLKKGDGAEVALTDTVTLDYQGTSWQTGEVFDQSFGAQPITHAASGFVPGFTAALVGQKVGSQLLVVIPPVYGYGDDPEVSPLGGQTLVFLIEIKSVE